MPQAAAGNLETFAGNCTDPKTVFNVQDTDLTVCAKFTVRKSGWRVIWSNATFRRRSERAADQRQLMAAQRLH